MGCLAHFFLHKIKILNKLKFSGCLISICFIRFYVWILCLLSGFMADLNTLAEQALLGTDCTLVEALFAQDGLIKITIDRIDGVRIEDCEAVSRQLSRSLEVEAINFSRLEVGSPGADRPLRNIEEFKRFLGERVKIKLKENFQGKKIYSGILIDPEIGEGTFGLQLEEEKAKAKSSKGKLSKDKSKLDESVTKLGDTENIRINLLCFKLDEIERATLDPKLDFRGKSR